MRNSVRSKSMQKKMLTIRKVELKLLMSLLLKSYQWSLKKMSTYKKKIPKDTSWNFTADKRNRRRILVFGIFSYYLPSFAVLNLSRCYEAQIISVSNTRYWPYGSTLKFLILHWKICKTFANQFLCSEKKIHLLQNDIDNAE